MQSKPVVGFQVSTSSGLTSGSAQNNPEYLRNGGKAFLICQQLHTDHYKFKQPHQHPVHTRITLYKISVFAVFNTDQNLDPERSLIFD